MNCDETDTAVGNDKTRVISNWAKEQVQTYGAVNARCAFRHPIIALHSVNRNVEFYGVLPWTQNILRFLATRRKQLNQLDQNTRFNLGTYELRAQLD